MEKHWIDYVTAIGSVATPMLVLALTAVGWRYRQAIERQSKLDEKLREDRIATYNEILEPFVLILMSEKSWNSDPKNKSINKVDIAKKKVHSVSYRQASLKLALVSEDAVVMAFNDLMQYFYGARSTEGEQNELIKGMGLLGSFLLEIRRSMGNEATKLLIVAKLMSALRPGRRECNGNADGERTRQ
ncbi:MAG: hypothetical protein K9M02_05780 [Thiohalocapsa sp.]|nr:hypothetical protein [Thiohalocapsa sp.]